MAEKAVSRKRKRRSRSVSRELMSCWGEVTGWDTSLSVLPMRGSGVTHLESMQSIEIRGRLCSPVKRVDTFQILAFPRAELDRSKDGATSVGSILSMRSALDAAMHLTDPEFQHLLTTACSGRLASIHLCFPPPRYGRAEIVSVSFSTAPPEVDTE